MIFQPVQPQAKKNTSLFHGEAFVKKVFRKLSLASLIIFKKSN